jgi:hypothetical protein
MQYLYITRLHMKVLAREDLETLVTNGFSIIPVTEGKKNPHYVLGKSHDLLTRRSTFEEVAKWEKIGVKSWGIAGGAVSNNLVTLDFDEKHYEGLYDLWYARLADDQKTLVDRCFLNSTRNNGKHLRYRTETAQPTIKLARRVKWNEEAKKEIIETTAETKAEGGYALIPPSAGYATIHGDLNKLPFVTDEMHEELIDVLRTFNEVEDIPATEYEYKPIDTNVGDRPGDRFNSQASWKDILEPHGWIEESKNYWRRPGKKEGDGISATTDYSGVPMLYVFSSAASPFTQNKGYSKFHAYALLNYDGDFSAAAHVAATLYPQENSDGGTLNDWTSNKPHLWAIGEILGQDFGEEEWLVEKLISKQGMTALSGNPGDYKTWITMHIALCMSRNIAVLGKFEVAQGAVLIIDEEDHLRLVKGRLESLGAKATDEIYYLSQSGFKADNKKVVDALLEIVKEKNIKLVILDSLVRIHDQEENDAMGMAKVFKSLQALIKAGASVLFTHHHKKQQGFSMPNAGQMMRGSSDILAAVDCHITIGKNQNETDRLVIKQTKLRQAEALKPFEIAILKDDLGRPSGFQYAGDYDDKKLKAEEVRVAVVFLLHDNQKSRTEIHEALSGEFGKTAIDDGIKLAEEAGDIERTPKEDLAKGNRKKAYYRISGASALSSIELPISEASMEIGNQEEATIDRTLEEEFDDNDLPFD